LLYAVLGFPQEARCASLVSKTGARRSASANEFKRYAHVDQGVTPAAVPADMDPRHVLRDPTLSAAEKRDLLHGWAFDAYGELARAKTKPASASRLPEVIDALIDLDQMSDEKQKAA
jgi:hypothetical protein